MKPPFLVFVLGIVEFDRVERTIDREGVDDRMRAEILHSPVIVLLPLLDFLFGDVQNFFDSGLINIYVFPSLFFLLETISLDKLKSCLLDSLVTARFY